MIKPEDKRGFGIAETLVSLLIVGIILGVVARGYQAMSRLNLATYQMSQRMELSSFLQRVSYEVCSALQVTPTANGFTYQRIDPTLNLLYEEPETGRLPWPIPVGGSGDVMNPVFRVTVSYEFDSASNSIRRTAFSQTTTEAVNIGEFKATLEAGGRVLGLSARPKEMTAEEKTRVLLPVVQP